MEKSKNCPPEGFVERLEKSWIKSGMTQKTVAEQIGCERKSVNLWMQGAVMPDVVNIVHLCRLFNVSADYLLFGEEGENAVHTP